MPRSLFALAILLLAAARGSALTADSKITAATVYPDRAVVTRVSTVELPAGTSEIVFEKLPPTLVDASLQVSARGTAGATLLDVSARNTYLETSPDPRIQSLQTELDARHRDDRQLQDQLAVVDRQLKLLASIEAQATQPATGGDNPPPRPSFDEWEKLMSFSTEHATRLAGQKLDLDQQRQTLALKIASLESQLADVKGRAPASRAVKTVAIRVDATAAGSLELTLAYALPGASWTPAYDARLLTAARTVALTYFGVVRNTTGEDWSGIALTLSTARPNLGGAAPELAPWFVDIARPTPADTSVVVLSPFSIDAAKDKGYQAFNSLAGSRIRGGVGGADQPAPPPPVVAALAVASLDASLTSATFRIGDSTTLASDGSARKVAIATATLPATLQYQATPRAAETAFLGAYAVNTTGFPLLAGALNAFLDDTFIAASRLKTVMPGEKLELALGADESIAIKRRLVNRFTENTGFGGGGRRVTYEFLVTVTNNKSTTEHIVFKEPTPVSRDEHIVVKLLNPAERDVGTLEKPREITREEDGRLVWRFDLAAGAKREFPLKFSIDYPANLSVSGVD